MKDPFLVPISELSHDHPNFEDRLLWDFSSATYQQWFDQGAEEFPQAEAELEEQYSACLTSPLHAPRTTIVETRDSADVKDRLAQTTFDESEQLESKITLRRAELLQLQAQEVSCPVY